MLIAHNDHSFQASSRQCNPELGSGAVVRLEARKTAQCVARSLLTMRMHEVRLDIATSGTHSRAS